VRLSALPQRLLATKAAAMLIAGVLVVDWCTLGPASSLGKWSALDLPVWPGPLEAHTEEVYLWPIDEGRRGQPTMGRDKAQPWGWELPKAPGWPRSGDAPPGDLTRRFWVTISLVDVEGRGWWGVTSATRTYRIMGIGGAMDVHWAGARMPDADRAMVLRALGEAMSHATPPAHLKRDYVEVAAWLTQSAGRPDEARYAFGTGICRVERVVWWGYLRNAGTLGLLAMLGGSLLLQARKVARELRVLAGQCASCGYSRQGLDFGVACPECGRAIRGSIDPSRRAQRATPRWPGR
jgi:hypothetical protein